MKRAKRDNPEPHDESLVEASAAPETDLSSLPHTEDGAVDLDGCLALIVQLEAERDEMRDRATRALADFQNFQRRAALNEQEARRQGLSTIILSLLAPLDHFDLALQQDPEAVTAAALKQGVQSARDELMRALTSHGVEPITPACGDEFDPSRHEAMLEQPAEGIGPRRVAMILQTGYSLGSRILRPAKVAVTPADGPADSSGGPEPDPAPDQES